MEAERPEQYRGVPYLAPIIVMLRQLTQYTEAELTAAIIMVYFQYLSQHLMVMKV